MSEWLRPFVEAGMEDVPRPMRVDLLVRIQAMVRYGRASEIDDALGSLPVETLAESTLMTLLRGTFMFRALIPGWEGFRDRVGEELSRRKAPTEILMIGLG